MSRRCRNRVELIGHLGANPELHYTSGGKPVVNFSLATNQPYRNETGELVEDTAWHHIIAWDKLAETCNEYLQKGSYVFIEGRIQYRSWEDQQGQKHNRTEIIAREMLMLDSRADHETSVPAASNSAELPAGYDAGEYDDELPFLRRQRPNPGENGRLVMRTLKILLTLIWVAAGAALIWVGIGPYLGALATAISGGAGDRINWGHLAALAWGRLLATPWALALMLTALLANALFICFVRYALRRQRAAASAAERNSTTYLVTLGRDDMVPVMQMREFWLGVRDGLMRQGIAGWLDRMYSRTPYLAWCDLGQVNTPHQSAVYLRVVGDPRHRRAVAEALAGLHPSAQVQEVAYPTIAMNAANTTHVWLKLARPSEHQIRTEFDELVDIRAALHRFLATGGGVGRIEVAARLRPAGQEWATSARRRAHSSRNQQTIGEWRGEQERSGLARNIPHHGVITNWRAKAEADRFGWNAEISVTVTATPQERRRIIHALTENYFGAFTADNRFVASPPLPGPAPLGYPPMTQDRNVLSPAECAAMLHLSKAANLPGLAYAASKYLPADRDLEMGVVPFVKDGGGRIVYDEGGYSQMQWQPEGGPPLPARQAVWRNSALGYNGGHIIGIQRNDRMKGTLVIGPPGVGKSSLLEALALGDIASGDGVAVIEPHRDLVTDIMTRLARQDWGRVIYIDPQELYAAGRSVTINVMEGATTKERRTLIQNQTVQVIRAMFETNWEAATRMQSLLHNALGTILEQEPRPTLRNIARFMGNQWYRDKLKAATRNPDYRHYWEDYFDPSDDRDRQTMIGPVYTRVTKALQNPYSAQIVSSAYSSVNLGEVMEGGGILLVNLPGVGRNAGDETMGAIAALILSKMRVEAETRRGAVDKADRRPFYVILDEAHLIVNETVEDMAAQFRKFRLGLTLAFQTLSQLEPDTRGVLAATMQNKIIFRAEGADSEIASELMLNNEVLPTEVSTLPNRSAYARLLWRESPKPVCTLQTLTLPAPPAFTYAAADIEDGRIAARRAYPATNDALRVALDLIARTLAQTSAAYTNPDDIAMQAQLEALEEGAIGALMGLSEDDFDLARQVQRERDRTLAAWLLQNPGAVGSQVELIKQVSMLRHSVPQVLVTAEIRREEASFTAEMRASGWQGRPVANGGRGTRPPVNTRQPNVPVPNPVTAPAASATPVRPASPTTRSANRANPPAGPAGGRQRDLTIRSAVVYSGHVAAEI
jgi:single stranded DNA-binding protein